MISILVIDDEVQARMMLRKFLERQAYVVHDAEDGDAGLKVLRENTIDVIITDIVMPNKEGLETITEIRSIGKNVKIIAMSGGGRFGNTDYLEMAKRFGADVAFSKPLDLNILKSTIEGLVNGDVSD